MRSFNQFSLAGLIVLCCVLTTTMSLQAGPFRRYPTGSARSQYTRIADSHSEHEGSLTATESGLPPMPRDPSDDVPSVPDPADSAQMQVLERPGGCGLDLEDEEPSAIEEWVEFLRGKDGLYFEYVYTGEVFTNTRGGLKRGTEYNGLIDVVLIAELEEMGFAPGGTLFVYGQNNHGRALTENHVGDFQTYSNIDAEDFTQLSEFWYERDVIDDFIAVRVGRQDANAEFAVVDLGGDFVQSSFGYSPTILLPSFPFATMGVISFWQLTEEVSFKAGVFDGGGTLSEFGVSRESDVFSIFELKSTHEFNGLPGDLHAGIWYHNGVFDEFPTGGTVDGNHGVYLGADQLLWKEDPCDEESDQGLGVFAQYGWTPQDRNDLRWHLGAGVVYKGLIEERDDDIFGVGYSRVEYSRYLTGQSAETVIEVFYKAPINDHLTLQPDIQYIGRPSGMLSDALVTGLRFELAL